MNYVALRISMRDLFFSIDRISSAFCLTDTYVSLQLCCRPKQQVDIELPLQLVERVDAIDAATDLRKFLVVVIRKKPSGRRMGLLCPTSCRYGARR
jgi:hypothetical protein